MTDELEFHILRGKRIEEFNREELIALYHQIEDELPEKSEELSPLDVNKVMELELIEDELSRRHESL